jgi:hypothetical protein
MEDKNWLNTKIEVARQSNQLDYIYDLMAKDKISAEDAARRIRESAKHLEDAALSLAKI